MSTTEDEEIGSIRDPAIYRNGSIVVVIDGDFLGIGEKKVTLSRESVELARDTDEGIW